MGQMHLTACLIHPQMGCLVSVLDPGLHLMSCPAADLLGKQMKRGRIIQRWAWDLCLGWHASWEWQSGLHLVMHLTLRLRNQRLVSPAELERLGPLQQQIQQLVRLVAQN